MVQKDYVKAQALLDDSFRLGSMVLHDNFRPDCVLGILRGGAPVAIAVHELLNFHGIPSEYLGVGASSYQTIDQQRDHIQIDRLDYVIARLATSRSLLIVDDVFDSGRTIQELMDQISNMLSDNSRLSIRIATIYLKPLKQKVPFRPDYFLHETNNWLVFPHELQGLSNEEVAANKPIALGETYQGIK